MPFENIVDERLEKEANPIYEEVLHQLENEKDREVFRGICSASMSTIQQSLYWPPILSGLASASVLLLPRMFPRIPVWRSYYWPTKSMANQHKWTPDELYARRKSTVKKTVGFVGGVSILGGLTGVLAAVGTSFLMLKDSGRSEEIMDAIERANVILMERDQQRKELSKSTNGGQS